jgi:very-long-chain enoyl-CoA reductase
MISERLYVHPFEPVGAVWRYAGIAAFLIGQSMNFYCHMCLRSWKKKNGGIKVIPRGLLFDQICCPHFTFEIVTWFGYLLLTQTIASGIYAAMNAWILIKWARER